MTPTLRATLPVLLILSACTGEPLGDGASTSGDPQASDDVALKPARSGAPAMLDTGIDLSHLKDTAPAPAQTPVSTANDPFGPQVPNPAAGPPSGVPAGAIDIVEGEETIHFGELLEGETASKRFHMRSSGDNPLIIERVRPSCGCTAAEIELIAADGSTAVYQLGTEIPAGTDFAIETTVDTKNRRGPFQSNIAIYSNDPQSPLRLRLGADVKAVLEVEPLNLDFGTITSGETRDGVFTISTSVLGPFMVTLDESRIIEPLTASLAALDPDPEGRSKTWELKVTLGPGIPEGIRRYPLRVISDVPVDDHDHDHDEDAEASSATHVPGALRELNCTVQANVTALVVATPNFISLGLVRPGQVVERTVKIECKDPQFTLPENPTHRITSLTGGEFGFDDQFSVTATPSESDAGRTLDVTVRLDGMPDAFNGSFGGMVQVDVGHPTKETVNIRFSGVSRAGIPDTSQDNRPPSDG